MSYLRHPYVTQMARNRYKLLVGSLLFLVLGSGFVPASADPRLFAALLLQNMLVGVLVFWEERPWVLLGSLLLVLGLEIAGQVWGWSTVRAYTGGAYSIFCFSITLRIFRKVLAPSRVTTELLAATMCGFVLLGMVGTFLFVIIDVVQPGAFTDVGQGPGNVQSLNYFSFITLLTVGYGDIVPLSNVARKATILLGLLGHFYDVFVISVIVGKYLGGVGADEAPRP
ncbi:potassium channel family protein [Hymenobacter sp. H14-R3]|uniref:potassium channel family protein n=1 Tax=Hymenobacter sp. H14-R3 TaxID=3046308 RepID=UPI0024BB9A6A|nr:potassium channel family protein [Hymenobacter sp. H14-R3]MDJ0365879.1 potassium channel family protein [Hymenobacter sp. H14-R3]